MDKHELTALAERVEAAEGPSRELDREIAIAVGRVPLGFEHDDRWPAYTASIDAALTLVPEGWVSGFENWPDPEGQHARAWVKQTSINRIGRKEYWGHASDDQHIEAKAATPALALAAAALKARANG